MVQLSTELCITLHRNTGKQVIYILNEQWQ